MRSRVDWRCGAEWLLRLAALGLLGWCAWAAFDGGRAAVGASTTAGAQRPSSDDLRAWSRDPDLAALHLALDSIPDATTRDWLRALNGAGTRVTWSGDVPAVAIAAEPVADPRGGVRVSVAAPSGTRVRIADEVAQIDTLTPADGGGVVRAASIVGMLRAQAGGAIATTRADTTGALRSVVVLGRAGWEAKFVAAALEEHGWQVTARMPVAPGIVVGAMPAFDTARVSAVVALDSTAAAGAAAIARFVRSGGGVVLGPEAARLPAFAPLAAGRAGATVVTAASYAAAIAPVTRQTLPIAPITALRPDAVALERREGRVVLAARRVDAGRVLQLGYDETWRWRMAGSDDAPDAHRRWWSEVVGSVAHAPVAVGDRQSAVGEPAPRAGLVAALGEPTTARDVDASDGAFDPSRSIMVYLAIATLLLLEWASRRLRGAR